MEKSLNNNQKAIDYLLFLRDKEIEKPQNEMDFDLIEACVELLLDLQNKKADLSPEQIEERVRKIPFKETIETNSVKLNNKKTTKKKIFLIAAVIAILVTIFTLISTATEWSIFKEIRERFGNPANMPFEVKINANDESFFKYNPTFSGSFEEAKEQGVIDFLVPKDFNGCPKIDHIESTKLKNSEYVSVIFNDKNITYTIYRNQKMPQLLKDSDNVIIKEINKINCYIEFLDDVKATQIHFEYDGSYYFFTHNYQNEADKDFLLKLVENLEVIK